MRQQTEWGYIDWEYLPDEGGNERWMSMGVTTILPGNQQPPHVHYGHEQFLYVLSGTGTSRINGEQFDARPGAYQAIPANATHEVINTGEEPLTEILISVPVPLHIHTEMTGPIRRQGVDPERDRRYRQTLYTAINDLKANVLDDVSIPFSLHDAKDQIVIHNPGAYPKVCTDCCDPQLHPDECSCQIRSIMDAAPEDGILTSTCEHQMKYYLIPIQLKDRLIGTLRGGQHYSAADPSGGSSYYDTPRSTERGIIHIMQQLGNSISSYCDMLNAVSELEDQKQLLNQRTEENTALRQDLTEVKEKITNLKINHHFLFNTLNSLAGMALTGDRYDLYTSIVNLSKMFRYTMVTNMQMVALKREIEYLQTYLSLQKLRYGDGLNVNYDIDSSCLDAAVPFNFLQPIVENAFTHGFMSYDYEKYISIEVKPEGDRIRIHAINNGIPPEEGDLEQIR